MPASALVRGYLAHNYRFSRAVHNFLDCNWFSIPGVNHALVAVHGCESSTNVEDGPIFLDESSKEGIIRRVKVGDIQLCGQLSAMQGLVKVIVEFRVNDTTASWGTGNFLHWSITPLSMSML